MKCISCGKGIMLHGVTLIRQNPKGVEGIWKCESCNKQTVPEDLARVIAVFQNQEIKH